jgi:hypothetical protein
MQHVQERPGVLLSESKFEDWAEREGVKFSKLTTHSQRKYKAKRKNKSDFGFNLHIFTISFTG